MTAQETALVMLLRHTGMRISEATRLKWNDVDLEGGKLLEGLPALIVRESKTSNGKRTIPLPSVLVKTLKLWKHFPDGRVRHRLEEGNCADEAAVRPPTRCASGGPGRREDQPSLLRREYATSALNRDVPLHVVSRALGHASTTVTERSYARLTNNKVAAGIMEAYGEVAT